MILDPKIREGAKNGYVTDSSRLGMERSKSLGTHVWVVMDNGSEELTFELRAER